MKENRRNSFQKKSLIVTIRNDNYKYAKSLEEDEEGSGGGKRWRGGETDKEERRRGRETDKEERWIGGETERRRDGEKEDGEKEDGEELKPAEYKKDLRKTKSMREACSL